MLLECPLCEKAVVVVLSVDYYKNEQGEEEAHISDSIRLWPDPIPDVGERLPRLANELLENAQRSYSSGAYASVVIVSLQLIDALERFDQSNVANMSNDKTPEGARVSVARAVDAIRRCGQSLREVGRSQKTDADFALTFVRHICNVIFGIQQDCDDFDKWMTEVSLWRSREQEREKQIEEQLLIVKSGGEARAPVPLAAPPAIPRKRRQFHRG